MLILQHFVPTKWQLFSVLEKVLRHEETDTESWKSWGLLNARVPGMWAVHSRTFLILKKKHFHFSGNNVILKVIEDKLNAPTSSWNKAFYFLWQNIRIWIFSPKQFSSRLVKFKVLIAQNSWFSERNIYFQTIEGSHAAIRSKFNYLRR